MNKPDRLKIASDLEYYLGRTPTDDEVLEATDWSAENPDISIAEYVATATKIVAAMVESL